MRNVILIEAAGGPKREPRTRRRRQWRSGTTTLPARIAAAESMRQPVEFSPFASGGRHCQRRHRCPHTVYAEHRASRDWRHCWRASAPVRHHSRRAGVIINTCAAVIKPLGPSGFVVVFLLPPYPTRTAQHRMFTRSHVPLDRRRTDAPSPTFAHAHTPNKGVARRLRRASKILSVCYSSCSYFVVARVGEGGASWWGYISITVVIIISLTKPPLQHVFLPPPPPTDHHKRSFLSGQTANGENTNPHANNCITSQG